MLLFIANVMLFLVLSMGYIGAKLESMQKQKAEAIEHVLPSDAKVNT